MSEMSTENTQNRKGETAEDGLRPQVVEGGKGLVVTRIGKSFNKRPVVRSVSLSLKRGEVVGLLGPNGAGKTTCFYMISGLIPADTGSIEVDGHDVTSLPMYRRARLGIGYLPQEASIFPRPHRRTEYPRHRRTDGARRPRGWKRLVEALLAEFGITHVRNTPAIALSGGERRRVEIARAWRPIRPISCSTNRWPASIPSRWAKSATWCASQGSRHRRADHRPQCARCAGDHRPRLYPA